MGRQTKKPFSFVAKNKKNKKSRSTQRKSGSIGFESLEKREVMAANITATWAGSVLNIEGTPGADTITVTQDATSVNIQGSTVGRGEMGMYFSRSQISSIKINGLSGADTIKMVESHYNAMGNPIPMTVYGGLGDDVITGGSGSDNLYGGGPQDDLAMSYDSSLGLYVAPEGESFNWGGKQEKWMKSSTTGSWHFMTPDGSLYKQTQSGYAIGTLVTKFDPQYYKELSMLTEASSGLTAASFDRSLNLTFTGIQNYYGYNEKWFSSNSGMMNITPDGLIRLSPSIYSGIGTPIASLDPSYWADPTKLANAAVALGDVDTIDGKSGIDYIYGGREGDTLIGGYGDDVINGNSGNDTIWGGEKNNTVQYLAGDSDRIWGDAGDDTAYGGGDYDRLWGDVGVDKLYGDNQDDYLYGGTEGDYLYGGNGNDTIWGGYGIDRLYGGADNDKLYGEMEYDYLYGQEGADWCDAGAAGEYVDGGNNTDGAPERDINAWVTTVNNATYTDIDQTNGPTCWVLAAMGAASRTENLGSRITYLGDNLYKVNVYQRVNLTDPEAGYVLTPQYVRFDGTLINKSDPTWSSQEGETWMIIMHRALLQAASKWDARQSINSPTGGDVANALGMIAGKHPDWATPTELGSRDALIKLIDSGKRVTVSTMSSTRTLLPNHVYVVLGTIGNNVNLYNPHGMLVTVPWSAIVNDCDYVDYV